MKKFVTSLAVAAAIAGPVTGCTQQQAETVGGLTLVGAAAGAIVGRDVEGALIGAALGAAAGALIARDQGGNCYYANGRGGYYKARC